MLSKLMKLHLISIVLLSLSFSSATFGAISNFVTGEGRFYAYDDDSLSFIKKQLLFNAFKDVISKEFKALSLDGDKFWQKVDERFEEYFAPVKEKLDTKHGITEENKESPTEDYKKSLRLQRLSLKAKFGRLNRAITSYSIQKMTRSTQLANSRYLKIQAKVDRKMLSRIYYQFTREGETRHFEKIYITADFQLSNLLWKDVGVEVETDFTVVVKEYWKKWLLDNAKTLVDEVVVASPTDITALNEYMKIPTSATENIRLIESGSTDHSAMGGYMNSLWLKINVHLSKKDEDLLVQNRTYSLDGDFVLIDLRDSTIIHSHDFVPGIHRFPIFDLHQLSSNVASLVYRTPLTEFETFKKKLDNYQGAGSKINLTIKNVATIHELYALKDFLSQRGVTLNFIPKINYYENGAGSITLHYRGTIEETVQVLLKMDRQAVMDKKTISFENKEKPFTILLNTVPTEEDNSTKEPSNDSGQA